MTAAGATAGHLRALVVETEVREAAVLRNVLSGEGLAADLAADGEDALQMVGAGPYDIVILGVELPGIDGFETCRRMRGHGVGAPILMLSARDAVDDRVAGLDDGADAYMTKPIAFAELLARIRALVRRENLERPTLIEVDDLKLDHDSHRAWCGRAQIDLSPREADLLAAFMRHAGYVLSKDQLQEQAWDLTPDYESNTIEVYVRHLRRKIDEPFGRRSIETVRGAGYRLRRDRRRGSGRGSFA